MNHIRLTSLLLFVLAIVACNPTPALPTPTLAPAPATTAAPSAMAPTAAATPAPTSTPAPQPVQPGGASPAAKPPTPPPPPTSAPTARPSATLPASASPVPAPTIGVTLPITTWKTATLLVGPGNPGRLYALQHGEVFSVTSNYTGPMEFMVRLFTSDDFGATWRLFPGDLPAKNPSCLSGLSMDYARADALIASTCQGIYRWDGAQWTRFSAQRTGVVAVTYGKPNLLWATGFYPDPFIMRSEDGGATWLRADHDLDTFTGQSNIAIDPRDGKTIYSMINPKYAGSYLRRGDSSGHWVTMPTPEQGYTYIGMTIDGATGALYVTNMQNNLHWTLWRSPNPSVPDLKQVRWEMLHDFGAESIDNWVHLLASGGHPQGLALFVRADVGNCSPLQGIPCTSTVRRSLDGGKTWSAVPLPDK